MPLGKNALRFRENFLANKVESSSEKATFNMQNFRESVNQYFENLLSKIHIPDGIEINSEILICNDQKVKVIRYVPTLKKPAPVIIFHPGGGLALDMAKLHAHVCAAMLQAAQAAVICIQPELSPERKLPEILDAAYQATKYFYINAKKYNFNNSTRLL